jgi:urease accessory protein
MTHELLLLQLSDSAFPGGGFTHSGGFEAACQHGEARGPDDVRRIAQTAVRQAGRGALPFVMAAHRDPAALSQLDARVDLFLNQPVSNRASRAQGCALVSTAAQVFPGAAVGRLAETVKLDQLCGHHAPIFGALFRALSIDEEATARLWLYQSARTVISAAVRLGVIGMFDAQRLQHAVGTEIVLTYAACRDIPSDEAAQTAPILDLHQSMHDRLYSRLFQS